MSLVDQIRRHAERHYEDGGWDIIVECWEDSDIQEAIGNARTLNGALRKLQPYVSAYSDR